MSEELERAIAFGLSCAMPSHQSRIMAEEIARLRSEVGVKDEALTAAETALIVHEPERTDCVLGMIRRAKAIERLSK